MPGPARTQDAPAERPWKITDREGTAARRGAMDPRWSAADPDTPLFPGDWVKTGARGANALALEIGDAALLLGPGALVELGGEALVLVHAGEVEVAPREGKRVVVQGAQRAAPQAITARAVLRATKEGRLEVLAQDPRWLTGYRSNASTEAVGSLLATVDGRNVPLTLGYHKVVVDVRDQVARTEIEERFVNHTSQVLEGVFYFPLPADASISGFSMWIGDEQVHGEIVEKQRARAIYETILREKRDPGLLEWSGGNIFKARVYPIGAEKRIKITYTQVLPQTRRADGKGEFVYRHALQSELLRLTPLKQLAISITISSARPIAEVRVPSHAARVQTTPHAAKVEVEAQEYTPDRDLEVRVVTDVGPDPARAALSFVPHRRADDGYFMLLVDGPRAPERPAAEPLDLLLLADTSGSLAGPARDAQLAVVSALLEGLGEKDTVDVATCDGEVRWAFGRPTPSSPATREQALGHVEGRRPLGWTDLDRAIAAAAERAGPRTHVVYVGDGAVTTGDADASAFARRAPALWKGQGTFHAIVPGTTSEPAALRAIAALGGGTLRAADSSDPAAAGLALLAEVAAPRVQGLRLAFEGLTVAAVYPEVLPDLPAGAQHVVVGRWDASTTPAQGAKGRVRLTGTLGGAPIDAVTEVTLGGTESEDEKAASFIPRLWARAHLDHLLLQGSGPDVQQRVIALSEDFQLATPYTSFLVLETDADRERFQVKKRLRMRDGEEFFARGREDATHALTRQAVLAAKSWRRALRARALQDLADMNRGLVWQLGAVAYGDVFAAGTKAGYEFGGGGGGKGSFSFDEDKRAAETTTALPAGEPQSRADDAREADGEPAPADDAEEAGEDANAPAPEEPPAQPAAEAPAPPPARRMKEAREERAAASTGFRGDRIRVSSGRRAAGPGGWTEDGVQVAGGLFLPREEGRAWGGAFEGLVPHVPGPTPGWAWPGDPGAHQRLAPADLWRGRVAPLAGGAGLRIRTQVQRADGRRRLRGLGEALWLLGADRWATASLHREGEEVRLDWLEGGQRGALTASWLLGRTRPGQPGDAGAWTRPWPWWSLEDYLPYASWKTTVQTVREPGRAVGLYAITFAQPDGPQRLEVRVDGDGFVHSVNWFVGDEPQWGIAFGGVTYAGGTTWPQRITRVDGDAVAVEIVDVTVEALAPAAFTAALGEALAPREQAVLLGPLPELRAARAAARGGPATLEDRWALLGALAAQQRWAAARPHLDAVLELTQGKRGRDAVLGAALLHSRRHEELRLHVQALAAGLAGAPRPAEVAAALSLLGWAGVFHDGEERRALTTRLRAVVERHPELTDARWQLDLQEAHSLQSIGAPDEALAFLRAAVARDPERADGHQQLAYMLSSAGEPEAAVAHIDEALAKHGPWPEHERAMLVSIPANLLWSAQRFEALVARAERLERQDPASAAALADMHLTALVMLDRVDAAWGKVQAWTAPALVVDAKLEGVTLTRLQAAMRHVTGRGHGHWTDRIEEERAAYAAEVVRALARRTDAAFQVAQEVVHDGRFQDTLAGRALLKELLALVQQGVDTLPAAQLVRLYPLVRSGGVALAHVTSKEWEALQDALEARWRALLAANDEQATAVMYALLSYADGPTGLRVRRALRDHVNRAGDADVRWSAAMELAQAVVAEPWTAELQAEAVALLSYADGPTGLRVRRALRDHVGKTGDADARWSAAMELAQAVVAEPWTAELQAEAVALLADVSPVTSGRTPQQIEAQRVAQVQLLHQVVDFAAGSRAAAAVAGRTDHADLDRRKLAVARDEALRAARGAALELLAGLDLGQDLAPWLELERAWLQVKLGRDREAAWTTCHGRLAATLAAKVKEPSAEATVLAARAAATCLQLVATDPPAAREAHAAALASTFDAAIEAQDAHLDWREARLTLLLVLDRPADLEAALRRWFGDGSAEGAARWGIPLTYVLAETDRLPAAVEVMDRLEALDEVGHADLQRLALWLTALDRKADAKAAKVRAWGLVDEWTIQQSLQRDLQRVRRQGEEVPEELDPEALIKLEALLRKAESPQSHIWTVQQLYQTTRDFRLLEALAEGVLGHTAQRVYPLLMALRQVTDQLQEEATFDRLQAAIAALHARSGTTAVDRRALKLLEAMVAHRAAAQTQGAARHAQAAQQALQAAYEGASSRDGGWTPGEPALYAQLLASQGPMPGPVGEEQLRQLRELVRLGATPDERLVLTAHLAGVLRDAGRREEAARVLRAAIDAARAPGGLLASRHHGHLATLSSLLCGLGSHRDAEGLWQRELAVTPGHGAAATQGLRLQLHGVWRDALARDAEVSLGRGAKLYAGACDALRADLSVRTSEGHAYQLVSALTNLWDAADGRKVPVGEDVVRFAFGELPLILAMYQHRHAANLVGTTAEALRRHRDAGAALEHLVVRAEAEPAWLRLQHQHAWAQHGWRLTNLRTEARRQGKLTATLEERLLELVKRELRRDLRAHRNPPGICGNAHASDFWAEKAPDFAGVAREVLAERRGVEATVVHVAGYLWRLDLFDEAIGALADADARGLLAWQARATLCAWLEERGRWAEALPVAERLVKDDPRQLQARRFLALALWHTRQVEAAARAVKDAEAYLREVKAWHEHAAATLGTLAVEVRQPREGVRLLAEAVQLHTRSRPDRGVGGGTLSAYYRQLSQAYSGLGETDAAVDAACGAVISWGRHQHGQRAHDLQNLASVLERAADLDAYVARVDRQTAETGLENATLRRALGEVYVRRGQPKLAEAQLRRSLEAQPNDVEVHRALIAVLDGLGRQDDAAEQLLALADVSGHDPQVYQELGDRWTRLGRAELAERAYTNLVERLPHEAESHRLLALVREKQARFPDAVEQWRQVVRVRTDEPAGWLGLGEALVKAGQKGEAQDVARKVLGQAWESRFGDVHGQARELLRRAGG